jgi:glycine cleavage system H protein
VDPVPTDRKYSKTHEWFKVEGDVVRIGITKFAADELTDITFVALPPVGKKLMAGGTFGEIESVKATSELFSAVAGEVTEINKVLTDKPELVNTDSFNQGWMILLKSTDLKPLDALMDAKAYQDMIG